VVIRQSGPDPRFCQGCRATRQDRSIDAAVIAHFAEATKPQIRPLLDEATRLLADLVARRRQIIDMIGAERQREKRIALPRLKKQHRSGGQDAGERNWPRSMMISMMRFVDRRHGARKKTCSPRYPGIGPVIAAR